MRIGGMPCRMFISIGKAIETCAPLSCTACHPRSDIPVIWMNRLSDPIPILLLVPPWPIASWFRIGRIPNAHRIAKMSEGDGVTVTTSACPAHTCALTIGRPQNECTSCRPEGCAMCGAIRNGTTTGCPLPDIVCKGKPCPRFH